MGDFNEPNFGFIETNFLASDYTDSRGRAKPMYRLSRNAFALLAMGFNGKDALIWKIKLSAELFLSEISK